MESCLLLGVRPHPFAIAYAGPDPQRLWTCTASPALRLSALLFSCTCFHFWCFRGRMCIHACTLYAATTSITFVHACDRGVRAAVVYVRLGALACPLLCTRAHVMVWACFCHGFFCAQDLFHVSGHLHARSVLLYSRNCLSFASSPLHLLVHVHASVPFSRAFMTSSH